MLIWAKDLFDTVPTTLNPNVTGWLVYNAQAQLPAASTVQDYEPFDDFNLVPQDQQALYDTVDQTVVLNMKMDNLGDGAN